MKSGSAITSRESHDVRHFAAERHARNGRPRWKNEATSPRAASTHAIAAPRATKLGAKGRVRSGPARNSAA